MGIFTDSLGLKPWAFVTMMVLIFGTIVGLVIWNSVTRTEKLHEVGCVRTPVNWKNNTFYVTDDYYACPYGGK